MLTVAINIGTNLPSVASRNGQAAFLFLLTCAIAQPLRLSYNQTVYIAVSYTIVSTLVSLAAVYFELLGSTEWLYQQHLIQHHSATEY